MGEKKEEGRESFRVSDRRFGANKAEPQTKPAASASVTQAEQEDSFPPPEINFATFILSLSTSAMLHLGEYPDPMTGHTNINLPVAKQTIDLIEMLREKTKGNLDQQEERLLEHMLYDLRMRFVQKTGAA